MTNEPNPDLRLTNREVSRLVHNWIGVNGGYLGDFSYGRHDRFWMEVADLHVDTNTFPGTTRACFEETLLGASASVQAAVLRAILEEYPALGEPDTTRPTFRTPRLHGEILTWIGRLETGQVSITVDLPSATDIVRRALQDAEVLTRTTGPQSAVDRLHTAFHGYLHSLCDEAGIEVPARPTASQLFKALRADHPALRELGAREGEITRVLGSMANIIDSLNSVRNNASVAHPNSELIGEPEAVLVINTVRTLLG